MAHSDKQVCSSRPSPPREEEPNIIEDGSIIFSKKSNYLVESVVGEGLFGKVVKCLRLKDNKTVAIKVLKNKRHCFTHIKKELQALLTLKKVQPEKYNIVQMHTVFFDRGHFCCVFEHLDTSLYDFMEENDFCPLPLAGIRTIVEQLAVALQRVHSVGLTHCDIKLDNIMLVDHQKEPFRVKLIDFGLACDTSSLPQGSIIQALGYRSPEVFLGLPLTEAIDMWSLGCTAGRLYLGDRLFEGKNEYEMMRSIVQILGQPPDQMLDSGENTKKFFKRRTCAWKPSWTLKTDLGHRRRNSRGEGFLDSLDDVSDDASPTTGSKGAEEILFVDMLKKMLDLDPVTRVTPGQLLQHSFLTDTQAGASFRESETSTSEEEGQAPHARRRATRSKTPRRKRKHDSDHDDPPCSDSKRAKAPVSPVPSTSSDSEDYGSRSATGSSSSCKALKRKRSVDEEPEPKKRAKKLS